MSPKGGRLVGYCPLLPYSREELGLLLQTCGCPHYKSDSIKMLFKYFEHRFLSSIVAPITAHQKSKNALKLLVSDQRIFRKCLFKAHMAFFKCKYA